MRTSGTNTLNAYSTPPGVSIKHRAHHQLCESLGIGLAWSVASPVGRCLENQVLSPNPAPAPRRPLVAGMGLPEHHLEGLTELRAFGRRRR